VDPAPCFVFRTIWNHVFTLCFVVLLSATIKILFSPCRQSGDLLIGSSGDRFQITPSCYFRSPSLAIGPICDLHS
jgi:hypothetical protein